MYALYLVFQLKTHSYLFADEASADEEEEAKMNLPSALGALLGVTLVTAFCADYLVGSIDEFASSAGIPKMFIGLVLLPIVGNAAEHVTSVWMAAKGKMELAIGVAVGSSIVRPLPRAHGVTCADGRGAANRRRGHPVARHRRLDHRPRSDRAS